MIRKIVDYLDLNHFGWLEMLFAMYLILCGYEMVFSSSILVLILMVVFAASRKRIKYEFSIDKPIMIFLIYYFIHDGIVLFFFGQFSFLNNYVGNAIILLLIPFIAKALQYKKMVSCLNWVAIISVIGLLYHVFTVFQGGYVTPIQIPFLSMNQERVQNLVDLNFIRPTSFFVEPQAFVSFILVPLFLSLYHKKYFWSAILIISLFLSTSTTGIIAAFLILFFYFFNPNRRSKTKLLQLCIVLLVMSILYYFLIHSQLFSVGFDKIQRTDFSSTERISQGLLIVSSMDWTECILGAPYFSQVDYCMTHGLSSLIDENGMVYMSTIWSMIFRYGIVGLCLYLYIFLYYFKKSKELLSYIIVYIITLFSNPDTIGGFFAFSVIFIIAFTLEETSMQIKKKIAYEINTYRVGIRKPNA